MSIAPATPTRPPAITGHIPALDGIRGLAIALVIFHHLSFVDPAWMRLGQFAWIGVDLFFLLSGYLITGILLDSKRGSQAISAPSSSAPPGFFINFYARRLVRIFPLYYAFVLLRVGILPAFAQLHRTYPPIPAGESFFYWAFFSNFLFAAHPPSFNTNILDVSWSLAVEEHFYLVWPLIIAAFSRRSLAKVLIAIITSALLIRIIFAVHRPGSIEGYVLTFCRMDSLAAGALIAILARRYTLASLAKFARLLLPASLLAVILLMSLRSPDWRDPFIQTAGFSLLALMFGSFLILGIAAPSPLGRFLSSPPMTFLGRYSYALYFVHSPIRDIVRYHLYKPERFLTLFGSRIPGMIIFATICMSLSAVAALISWHLYEKHFLKLKSRFPSTPRQKAMEDSALIEPPQAAPAVSS